MICSVQDRVLVLERIRGDKYTPTSLNSHCQYLVLVFDMERTLFWPAAIHGLRASNLLIHASLSSLGICFGIYFNLGSRSSPKLEGKRERILRIPFVRLGDSLCCLQAMTAAHQRAVHDGR